jgi:glycopeptidolipid biosynthesis protein
LLEPAPAGVDPDAVRRAGPRAGGGGDPFAGRSLTYAELDERRTGWPHLLAPAVPARASAWRCCSAVRRGDRGDAGGAQDRAAYVPIDPAHSVARMDFVLKDAPVAVITTADMHSRFEGRDVWVIDIDDEVIEAQSRTPLAVPAAENMAYVIYTSGTTVPKGVAIAHQQRDVAGVAGRRAAPGPGVDAVPFPAFDFSVWEIWGALLSGRRLLVVPEDVATRRSCTPCWSMSRSVC